MAVIVKLFLVFTFIFQTGLYAQKIKPGFDATEYLELLGVSSKFRDSSRSVTAGNYQMIYRSPRVGFKNCYEVWKRADNVGVIHIQGTIADAVSWLANFYCPMVSATGNLTINDSTVFNYKLARNSNAYVHAGWLTALAHLAPGILSSIKQLQSEGVNEIFLFGHSQGGAITFLLSSYLHYLQQDGVIDKSIFFKTYCSAAPKPGNLQYAYDFDFINRNGSAFRVVNSADWVPESPTSLQTLNDFNEANPFKNAKKRIKQQKLLVRLYLKYVYNKLNGSSTKAMKTFQKQLGKNLYKQVKKNLPQYQQPQYKNSMNYMPAGIAVVLLADDEYNSKYKFDGKNVFIHHMLSPYLFLLQKQYISK